jgi:hypothetical protein
MVNKLIKSKSRVANFGEVFTPEFIVNSMLDLVRSETENINSKFLEPACGNGNFLVEVLKRKLLIIKNRYKKSQHEYETNSIIAIGSLYGIDLMSDNVKECKKRLFNSFKEMYLELYKKDYKDRLFEIAEFVLEKNIIQADALTMKTVGGNIKPIIFSQWSLVGSNKIKRIDYEYNSLFANYSIFEPMEVSDLGEEAFIPKAIKDYPLTHYLNIDENN